MFVEIFLFPMNFLISVGIFQCSTLKLSKCITLSPFTYKPIQRVSILGQLLFIIYINDLYNVSNILQPIMFAENTNLFSSHSNIKDLFDNVNLELNKITVWFKANKLSLNEGKTKYTFFHKFCQKDNIPLMLPQLVIKGKVTEWMTSIKTLAILLVEHLSWKNHISVVENKVS